MAILASFRNAKVRTFSELTKKSFLGVKQKTKTKTKAEDYFQSSAFSFWFLVSNIRSG